MRRRRHGSGRSGVGVGIIRIHFPDYGGDDEDLEEVSWKQWFEQFEDNDLALVYQGQTSDGEQEHPQQAGVAQRTPGVQWDR